MLDYETDLDGIPDAYAAMDERRAIKSLIRVERPVSGSWSAEQLAAIGDAVEFELASRRHDGSLRPYVTMWVVRVGDDIFVRSAGGPDRPWYRHARSSGTGRIRAGGIEAEVTFGLAPDDGHQAIDAAYHAKYDRFGPGPVGHVTGPDSHRLTIRLVRSEP